MSKKKVKNIVNVDDCVMTFEAMGFQTKVMNHYQIRLWHDMYEGFFDWYHTTGSLTETDARHGYCKSLSKELDADEVCAYLIGLHNNK